MTYKIAIVEEIHKDGLKLLDENPNYEYEIITDVSENNLIEKLPKFDACTLRVSKLDEKILKQAEIQLQNNQSLIFIIPVSKEPVSKPPSP